MGLACGILGPLQLRFDGRDIRLPAGRQRLLVAFLASHPGTSLSIERLIDTLWGAAPPTNPTNALQQAVFKLRRTLEANGAVDVLVTTEGGYLLALRPEDVDAARFEAALGDGEQALTAGDPENARHTLAGGLALWRGDALQDVTGEWAVAEAERLEERRLSATGALIDARLALGEQTACVDELTTLVTAHPLRERFRAQLMRALAASGRQADALTVYATGRELLAEELGLDPSPVLQQAHEDVLRQRTTPVSSDPDPGTTTRPGTAPPSPGAAGASRARATALPRPVSSFVGREEELDRLEQLLAAERLLTLTGPGGAGKSRLALELALRLTEGAAERSVHLASLAPLARPTLLVRTVAAALDVHLDPDDEVVDALRAGIHPAPAILVLDNAEHLLADVADLVEQLVTGCPQLTVLVTSREPLGLTGEVVWPVPTLPVPPEGTTDVTAARDAPAVRLFEERAQAVAPAFSLEAEDVGTVVALVRALDGLPLAIELAAARTRILSVPDLATQLQDRFRVLRDRRRGMPPRHRALEDTVEWSWDLLTEDERRAWMAAAVPRGGFDLELLGALLPAVGTDLDPLEAVDALNDRSLLTVDRDAGTTTYRMLETLREFGLRQLADSDVEVAVRHAHAAAVCTWLAATDRGDERDWDVDLAAQLEREPDIRAALRWSVGRDDRSLAQQLAGRLGWLWYATGRTQEGVAWCDRALGPVGPVDTVDTVDTADPGNPGTPVDTANLVDPAATDPAALTWAAMLRVKAPAATRDGLRWAERAVAATGDDPVLSELARIAESAHRWFAGDRDGARRAALHGGAGQQGWLLGTWELLRGQVLAAEGELAAAEGALLRAGTQLRDHGAGWWSVVAAETLLPLLQLRGDGAGAREAGAHYLDVCEALPIPNPVVEVELRSCLAMIAATLGDDEVADDHLTASATVLARSGAGLAHAVHAAAQGYVRLRRSDLAAARDALETAARWHDRAGRFFGLPFVQWLKGHAALAGGDPRSALGVLQEAYDSAVRQGVGDERAGALEGVAVAAAAGGDMARAALLLGAAEAERAHLGAGDAVLTLRDLEPQASLLARVDAASETTVLRARGATLDEAGVSDAVHAPSTG